MLTVLWRNLRWRKGRFALLVLGTAVLSTGLSYLAVLADDARGAVDQSLREHWKTSYDILVRPGGAAGPLERHYDMVEANHLSGQPGGITPEQVETIRSIPGVEVAAPVAVLGHVSMATRLDLDPPATPGLYRVRNQVTSSDGLHTYTATQTGYEVYYPHPQTAETRSLLEQAELWETLREHGVVPQSILSATNEAAKGPFYRRVTFGQLVLVAAVDPAAEAQLVGLDQSVVSGRYLTAEDQATPHKVNSSLSVAKVPVLLSNRPVSDLKWTSDYELLIPGTIKPDSLLAQIRQGQVKLESLQGTQVTASTLNATQLWERLKTTMTVPDSRTTFASKAAGPPSPLTYREVSSPSADWPLALEVVPVDRAVPTFYISGTRGAKTEETPRTAYRKAPEPQGEAMMFTLVGEYDPGKLTNVGGDGGINAVPMETYRPATGTVLFDLDGNPTAPQAVSPGDSPQDAFLSPPILITTLDAARSVMKTDAVVSAVRVRVKGTADLSEAAQARVQLVAEQIASQTGLQVDITLGSSPRRLLMRVPGWAEIAGLGFVEQPWVQKGAQILIYREINQGNLLLLLVVLAVGIVYVFATAMVSVVSRRRELALMSAVGWSPAGLMGSVLAEAALSAAATAGVGMLMAYLVGRASQLYMPPDRIRLAGLATASVYLIGVLGPALLAGRTRPMLLLRLGETGTVVRRLRAGSLLSLAAATVLSRWRRNLLSLAAIAVPTALMGFLLFITVHLKGILVLTLVGEALIIQVGPTHFITLGVALALAVITTADVMWLNISERRSELALMSALGWPRRMVRLAILLEGGVLGAIAGAVGLGVSLAVMGRIYQESVWPLMPLALSLLLVPVLTGVAGAIIPAEAGVRVPPATGLRTE